MSRIESVRVVLDIGEEAGTVSGRITADGAPSTCFFGWLELMDQLERVAGLRTGGSESSAATQSGKE